MSRLVVLVFLAVVIGGCGAPPVTGHEDVAVNPDAPSCEQPSLGPCSRQSDCELNTTCIREHCYAQCGSQAPFVTEMVCETQAGGVCVQYGSGATGTRVCQPVPGCRP